MNNMTFSLTVLRSLASATLLCTAYSQALAVAGAEFNSPATLLETTHYRAQRQGRFFVVSLKTPHQVLSTSGINGGQSTEIDTLVNYQSMEARGDQLRFMAQITLNPKDYHVNIVNQIGMDPKSVALMGTAANIQQMAKVEKHFADLTVTAFVTAGVKGNAQRSGDPTQWYQDSSSGKVINKSATELKASTATFKSANQGTINIMLLINHELVPGAQTKVALLATEAKSAALSELVVSSRSSSFLATGTGTDQLIIASPIKTRNPPLPSAIGHLKLGELVGSAVREAVLEALRWQNGLQASSTGNIFHALGRYGLSEELLIKVLEQHLSEEDYRLAEQNLDSLSFDARVAAAAYGYAELLDRLRFGNLPANIASEILLDQASQAAVAVSAKPGRWPIFWQALAKLDRNKTNKNSEQEQQIVLFVAAIAQGWQAKWSD